MLEHLSDFQIVLGSNSPRRKSLLAEMGVIFTTQNPNTDESFPSNLPLESVAEFLAKKKAKTFNDFSKNQLYITADTVVILDNEILNKPKKNSQALDMLRKLSGKTHQVITGVCIKSYNKYVSFSCSSKVQFKHLNEKEIYYYVNNFKPLDKAGAYGIQEWIGLIGVEKIIGSYFNIVGLPCSTLFHHLTIF